MGWDKENNCRILEDFYSVGDKGAVFIAIKERQGEQISTLKMAADSGVRETHCKDIAKLLLKWGYIEKRLLLSMGPRYKRYTYVIAKDYDGYTEYDATEEYSLHSKPKIPLRRDRTIE